MATPPSPSPLKLPPDRDNPRLRDFRVEFLPPASNTPFNVSSALRLVFQKLSSVDQSIIFYSSIGNTVIELSSFPTSTFTDLFKLVQIPRSRGTLTKIAVLFSAKTSHNSAAFSSFLRPWLQSTNTWLHDHAFGDKLQIVDLGYLFCRHPFRTYRDDLLAAIKSFFDSALAASSFETDMPTSLPHLELRRRQITHHLKPENRLPTESAVIRVDTFVLLCSADDVSLFLTLLQDSQLPPEIGVFSPASIRSQTHYGLLTDLIREHSHFLVSSRFLTIQGLPSSSTSDHFRSKLTSILSKSHLERTNSTATKGTWFLLYVGDDASPSDLKLIDGILSSLACNPDPPLLQARLDSPEHFDSCPRRSIPRTRKLADMATIIHNRNNARAKTTNPVPKYVTPTRTLQLSFVDTEDITLGSNQPPSVATPVTTNTKPMSSNHTVASQLTMETLQSTLQTVQQSVQQTLQQGLAHNRSEFTAALKELQRERQADREQDRAFLQQLFQSIHPSPARKLRRSDSDRNMELDSVPPTSHHAASSTKTSMDGPATLQHKNGNV